MKKSGARQADQGSDWLKVVGGLLKGCILALTVALLMLLACAWGISNAALPQEAMGHCVVIACIVGAMAGAAMPVSSCREMAVPLGFGTGIMMFFLLMGLGSVMFEGAPSLDRIPVIFFSCACGGGTIGILGRKMKKKHRR